MRRPRRERGGRRNPPDPIRAFGEAINEAIDGFFQQFAAQFDPRRVAEDQQIPRREWLDSEYERNFRRDFPGTTDSRVLTAEERKLLDKLLAKGYRQLAKDLHPDASGSEVEMRKLNALMEKLKK